MARPVYTIERTSKEVKVARLLSCLWWIGAMVIAGIGVTLYSTFEDYNYDGGFFPNAAAFFCQALGVIFSFAGFLMALYGVWLHLYARIFYWWHNS